MKHKTIATLVALGLACAYTLKAVSAGTPVTFTGEGACAKCLLKEGKECQPTLTVAGEGQNVTYYLKENEATKKLGKQLCTERKKVKVTGTVKPVDGKFELTATKVEIVTEVRPQSQ
ncbi:MAG: hypothetical protein KIS67_15930 [Verrucomicrobiae bacterium]|nr:hypothetical protein [Verrucomicrobiae bacterium]